MRIEEGSRPKHMLVRKNPTMQQNKSTPIPMVRERSKDRINHRTRSLPEVKRSFAKGLLSQRGCLTQHGPQLVLREANGFALATVVKPPDVNVQAQAMTSRRHLLDQLHLRDGDFWMYEEGHRKSALIRDIGISTRSDYGLLETRRATARGMRVTDRPLAIHRDDDTDIPHRNALPN